MSKEFSISFVVAADENNGIGKDNKLLCHLPADMKFFKALTWGHTLIMGRKTFESMSSKALPGRESIIITRQKDFTSDNCLIAHSVEQGLELAKKDQKIFIIGGADIFKQTISLADNIYLTRIHHQFECDSYFPEISLEEWQLKDEKKSPQDVKNAFSHSFLLYSRRKK